MGALGKFGKGVLSLALGTLAVLTVVKVADDRRVNEIWKELEEESGNGEVFSEGMVTDLPDPARRYFLHAIKPGTPLASRLYWRYSASMRPSPKMPWMDLQCEQVLVKERGFVWKTVARSGPLVMTGADHYLDGAGRMRIALYGLIPIVNASGPDLSKSALARLLMEGIALPSTLLPGPRVQIEGIDESRFRVTVSLHGEKTPITLTVDDDGRLKEFVIQRWGNLTKDGSYRYIPYGGTIGEERTFDGYTIPTRLDLGWWYGTEQYLEVIRATVEAVRLD